MTVLPFELAAVFRVIAPARMSIARATAPSFFDMGPPRYTTTAKVMYLFGHQCQAAR